MNGAVPLPLYSPDVEDLDEAPALGDEVGAAEATAGSAVGYALLFIPYAAALLVKGAPLLSYGVAWAGSVWILWLTLSGTVKPLPGGRSALRQVMRPVVLTQLIFVGYTVLSSVFYVMSALGYYYFTRDATLPVAADSISLAGEAQRMYLLAHTTIAAGMLWAMDYRRSGEWAVRPFDNPALALIVLSGIAYLASMATGAIPGAGQFDVRFKTLSLVASVLGLALAVPTRRFGTVLTGIVVYAANLGAAFLSGWKEEVLVMVLLLGVFIYPYYRKTVLVGAPLALGALLFILPTYADAFRGLNWLGDVGKAEAAAQALTVVQSDDTDIAARNWEFLTGRISEIGLFTGYLLSVESGGRYYGTQLVQQAAWSLVPRAFWAEKPVTEKLVMARVIENGVVESYSVVSAKPQYVVDGYLSGGAWGVALAGLVFGLLASVASRACERWFGGYLWGTGLVYTALFAAFWRGNSFEFFFNTVVWSFILLIPLFYLGRWTGVLYRADSLDEENEPVDAWAAEPEGHLEPVRMLRSAQ